MSVLSDAARRGIQGESANCVADPAQSAVMLAHAIVRDVIFGEVDR
jgi:hypothetical protein